MLSRIRDRDTVARIGGDEFAVLLEDCSLNKAQDIIEGMRKKVEQMSYSFEGRAFNITISAGIVPLRPLLSMLKMRNIHTGLRDILELTKWRVYKAILNQDWNWRTF